MAVQLEWVGHACFRIGVHDGPVVVTDPYTPHVLGLPDIQVDGDIVIVSSLTDESHSNIALVRGRPRVINALAVAEGTSAEICGTRLVAVVAGESPDHPRGARDNAMYAFRLGGVWFLHMGDLGYSLSPAGLAPFKNRCDVLLALTGGGLTVGLDDLNDMIETLEPRWIVPMHYGLPGMSIKMLSLQHFLAHRPNDPRVFTGTSRVNFPLDSAPMHPTIVVLQPSGCT